MEKKLSCTIQFMTTAPHPEEEIVEWFEELMALHLHEDRFYIKWKKTKNQTPE